MTIKTECVVAHLKHDYKQIGCVVAVLVAGVVCFTIPAYLNPSAYTVLNILAGCIVVLATVGVAVFWDKETFATTNEVGEKTYLDVWFPIGLAGVGGMVIYGTYVIAHSVSNGWENPTASFAAFVLLILIGTPIACAIARCKE
jgi:hypothetical protein